MARLMIVDTDAMAAGLMELFIKNSGRHTLECVLPCAQDAAEYCIHNAADLVLLDVQTLQRSGGAALLHKWQQISNPPKFVLMTSLPEESYLSGAAALGADGFWYKTPNAQELFELVDAVLAGANVFPQKPPAAMLGNFPADQLSYREKQVLRDLVRGFTDARIAADLLVSVSSVKTYVAQLREKAGCENRTALAVCACRSGIFVEELSLQESELTAP